MAVKGAGNITVTYNSNAITDYINTANIAASISELDTTDLGSTAMEYIPGLADWTCSVEVTKWDATVDGYLMPDIVSPGTLRTLVVTFNDDTSTVTYTWTSNAFITAGTLGGGPNEVIGLTGLTFRCVGAPSRAVS
jgi:hypothetical protein